MLTCIACSKQLKTNGSSLPEPLEEDYENVNSPSAKQAVKSLTIQIKDIALKASSAYKNCKPCSGQDRNHGGYEDSDVGSVSERFYGSYRRTGYWNPSTPRFNRRKEMEAKLAAYSSGSATPASVSSRIESIVFVEEDEPKEWVAQVEPGVLITFVSLPQGGNDLKRIRFSREIFNKWQAQKWWTENYDKVLELYNVRRRLNPDEDDDAPLPNQPRSEDQDSVQESGDEESPTTPPLSKEQPLPKHFHRSKSSNQSTPRHHHHHHHHNRRRLHNDRCHNSTPKYSSVSAARTEEASSVDASARSSHSSGEVERSEELSNASDLENEWVEQDQPGVYITVRALPNGGRELRRVRFSREMFGETQARVWWEENKARIQKQYL